MLLGNIITNKKYGSWIFEYKGKKGIIFFDPFGENVHINYGYNENKDMPELYGDYENLAIAINSFCIDGVLLKDLIDDISCERIIAGK